MQLKKALILNHQQIADKVYLMRLQVALDNVKPGQFVHIKIGTTSRFMLRRPISIAEIHEYGITIIYRVNGEGTQQLSMYKTGSEVDLLGPLGNGYDLSKLHGKIVLFGGGIGVPPMYELAKQLKSQNKQCVCVLGFQSKKDVFFKEQFSQLFETIITTVDGSEGICGFVTDVIQDNFDMYCGCGPIPMLKALQTTYPNHKGFISIEKRMACGIGACYACVCNRQEDYTRVCIDGPVYESGEVELCD